MDLTPKDGGKVESREDYDEQYTPLMAAVYHNHPASVRMLLSNGHDPLETNKCGQSAFSLALEMNNASLIDLITVYAQKCIDKKMASGELGKRLDIRDIFLKKELAPSS